MENIKYYDGSQYSIVGSRFGRWTVLDRYTLNAKRERNWLCRCDCGTERYVVERSLKSGNSTSCGCLRRENAEKAISKDLTGRVFGDLTVLRKSETQCKSGGVEWVCECSCGNTYTTIATLLLTGKRTNCGGNAHKKNYASTNITGKKFGRLTAVYATPNRDKKGSVIWHCKCDCGNETDISYNSLLYCSVKSCGCRKIEHSQNLSMLLTHIDGTSLDLIRSEKIPTNNTTGTKGVYLIRGKYVAKITFQKRTYSLGTFSNINEAIEARKEAEETIFRYVSEFYDNYKLKADASPDWAKENPIKITVSQDEFRHLSICVEPKIELLAIS